MYGTANTKEENEKNQKRRTLPTLPSPSSFFSALSFFLFFFLLFFLLFLFGKKRARGAGSSRSQHARKAQPAVGIRLDFSTGPRGLFFCLLASSRKCATCSHRARAATRPQMFLPLSLEMFIQPKGIVPESAVLVRSFSLVFSYLCTQRCGTVCECRESLFSHPFSYETWWSRAYSMQSGLRTGCIVD